MQLCCGQAWTYKHPGYTFVSVDSNEEEHTSFVWTAGTLEEHMLLGTWLFGVLVLNSVIQNYLVFLKVN